jgi:hypothetical protein
MALTYGVDWQNTPGTVTNSQSGTINASYTAVDGAYGVLPPVLPNTPPAQRVCDPFSGGITYPPQAALPPVPPDPSMWPEDAGSKTTTFIPNPPVITPYDQSTGGTVVMNATDSGPYNYYYDAASGLYRMGVGFFTQWGGYNTGQASGIFSTVQSPGYIVSGATMIFIINGNSYSIPLYVPPSSELGVGPVVTSYSTGGSVTVVVNDWS